MAHMLAFFHPLSLQMSYLLIKHNSDTNDSSQRHQQPNPTRSAASHIRKQVHLAFPKKTRASLFENLPFTKSNSSYSRVADTFPA